jgi:ribosomal protein L11 methyltransferase
MPLYEASLVCQEKNAQAVCDAFELLEALSITVEDALAQTDHEDALFAEPNTPAPKSAWNTSRISALFADEEQVKRAQRYLHENVLQDQDGLVSIQEVADQDWVRLTQSQFTPIQVTPEFYIVPSWHETPIEAKYAIALDPGLAFGTGSHPTTHLCLTWLSTQNLKGKRVLDYGCGSGILAIAAALMGAEEVVAVDIDPAAVEASHFNASKNNVSLHAGLPELANKHLQAGYDIVIANILSNPLKVLAPLLSSMLHRSSLLLLSGILVRQTDEMVAAYAPYVDLKVLAQEEGWVLMCSK